MAEPVVVGISDMPAARALYGRTGATSCFGEGIAMAQRRISMVFAAAVLLGLPIEQTSDAQDLRRDGDALVNGTVRKAASFSNAQGEAAAVSTARNSSSIREAGIWPGATALPA